MGKTLAEKIIEAHLVSGDMVSGEDIGLRIDQTLTQDATGTMAYLEFESMGIPRVRTERSVAYVDHNTLQSGFENADDHRYLASVAAKYGIWYSRPGNGICHQVHYERFGIPGKTLIGSDSHTPTGGGLGMLAIGAGGMDVAVAMAGGAYHIPMPRVMEVRLSGALRPNVSAKDVILEVLRRLTVKGGVGAIIEYTGEGVKTLSVPERCTITNMGAELGATSSIFPADEVTKEFLAAEDRIGDYRPMQADADAVYSETVEIDLSTLVPLAACPHSPDRVVPVSELAGKRVDQVAIGSCTNSSLADMTKAASILRGHVIADHVSFGVSPGSRQVFTMMTEEGLLNDFIDAGARIIVCACGPCIGMGFSPNSGGVSLRTFNRNFLGRSGTKDAEVYLVSPETAAASALTGVITDPLTLPPMEKPKQPRRFRINDSGIIAPLSEEEAQDAVIVRGPNIKPFPKGKPLEKELSLPVLLKVEDNITTDHIMPAGSKVLPYRSNIPKLSEFCFGVVDETFAVRAAESSGGIIVGGENYGQGSSREHAALVPRYLGIRAVIAKSFARIHAANLVNAGILPLVFIDPTDYDWIEQGMTIAIHDIHESLEKGMFDLKAAGRMIPLRADLSPRQKEILLAGGLLEYAAGR